MHIRITEQRRGTTYEVLCDVCGQTIDLDENCDYLTMRNGVSREANIAHRTCGRIPGRFTNHWTQMIKPRHIIQDIANQNRHPVLIDFLHQLEQQRKDRQSHV